MYFILHHFLLAHGDHFQIPPSAFLLLNSFLAGGDYFLTPPSAFLLLLFLNPLRCSYRSRRTDEAAEMTTHTVLSDDAGLAGGAVEADGLMTAVHARGVAASAADATLTVDVGIDNRLTVEGVRQHEVRKLLTHQFVKPADAALLHIRLHTQ